MSRRVRIQSHAYQNPYIYIIYTFYRHVSLKNFFFFLFFLEIFFPLYNKAMLLKEAAETCTLTAATTVAANAIASDLQSNHADHEASSNSK